MTQNKTLNQNYIKQLYTIIDEECTLYKSILEVEKEKNGLLMSGVFTDLEPVNDKLSGLMKKSVNLEQKRINIANFITRDMGLPANSSLKRLLVNLPNEYESKFNKIYDEFLSIITEIKRLNDINSRLISDTLRVIDVTLNAYIDENSSMEIDYGKQLKGKKKNGGGVTNPKLFSRDV